MEVVIDTNVVVSAAINSHGPPADTIRAWRAGAFAWITSQALLDEMERVLLSSRIEPYLWWSRNEMASFLNTVRQTARIVVPGVEVDAVSADPSDNRVLEAALAAKANYIISGDKHLLELGEYEGIRVVSPARFAAMLVH